MVGGGAFQPYLADKDSLQGWGGSVSSGQDGSVQEALLTPVCDTSYSNVLQGMQPFDRGRGFSHQEEGLSAWRAEAGPGQVADHQSLPAPGGGTSLKTVIIFFCKQPS